MKLTNKYMKNEPFLSLHSLKKISVSLLFIFTFGCSKEEIKRNPFLYEVSFNHVINLNLPEYDNLNFAGGSKFVPYGGINGLLIFNINGTDIFAWEATCSNHNLESCSKLSIEGFLANCDCENYKYSLATGQLLESDIKNKTQYPLLNYRTEKFDKTIIISN